jgi:hypothetical protein
LTWRDLVEVKYKFAENSEMGRRRRRRRRKRRRRRRRRFVAPRTDANLSHLVKIDHLL